MTAGLAAANSGILISCARPATLSGVACAAFARVEFCFISGSLRRADGLLGRLHVPGPTVPALDSLVEAGGVLPLAAHVAEALTVKPSIKTLEPEANVPSVKAKPADAPVTALFLTLPHRVVVSAAKTPDSMSTPTAVAPTTDTLLFVMVASRRPVPLPAMVEIPLL